MNPSETSWHYADGDEQKGPVPFEQIQREVGTGQLPSHTLVWSEGMPNWLPYRDVAAANLPSPIADTPGSSTLPQGHAPHTQDRLLIPATLKRVSFLKLLFVSLGAIALMCTAMGIMVLGSGILTPTGPSSGSAWVWPTVIIFFIAGIGVLIWAVVLSMIILYRSWLMIQAWGVSTTPGIAVGLQFIPFFNLYWAFRAYYFWAKDYNRVIQSDPRFQSAPRANEGAFLTYCICGIASISFNIMSNIDGMELLGLLDGAIRLVSLVVAIIMFIQLCSAINFFVDARDRDAVGRG
ncbi:MAG: DUF4339 domain-containing protein [Akkermansiaceae bacterium]|nr:DUF4339 domain-containing protein [Akkermansiaceae bacterium]